MSPREAGALDLEEPDWRAMFEQECMREPNWSRFLQEDMAFQIIFRRWREWHCTPIDMSGETKRKPAGAQDAMIALAGLGIMPPRFEHKDIPRGDAVEGYQHDDHCWLSIEGEQWRIVAIEDRIMILEQMFNDNSTEQKQIDLTKAKWDQYTATAVAILEKMMAPA